MTEYSNRRGLAVLAGVMICSASTLADDAPPKMLDFVAQKQVKTPQGDYLYERGQHTWDSRHTAVVVCDMWDDHWCRGAAARAAEMAPAMNRTLSALRKHGVLVVHCPSDTMAFYEQHPARKRAQAAPKADNLPPRMSQGCRLLPDREGKLPIDDSDGGCDCFPPCPHGAPWRRQLASIDIHDEDTITDSGVELWNLLEQRKANNVLILGVHANMCVVGRSFGIRNLVQSGKNVVLVRDLTDSMYNSRMPPHITHFRGTDFVVDHIERHWCPTTTSDQFVAGEPFRFALDRPLRLVVAISEPEYNTHKTLPKFSEKFVREQPGWRLVGVEGDPAKHTMPGLTEALAKADVLLLSVRRQALPKEQLDAVRKYLSGGGSLVAIRTSSHAFDARGSGPAGAAEWKEFDAQVLGGNYHGHHGENALPKITLADGAKSNPLLAGVELPFDSGGSLYKVSPLSGTAAPLLMGQIPDAAVEPVAWTHRYGKSRVFYTSLGHADDFAQDAFSRLLTNAIQWAAPRDGSPR